MGKKSSTDADSTTESVEETATTDETTTETADNTAASEETTDIAASEDTADTTEDTAMADTNTTDNTALVYVGPTIKPLMLFRNQSFKNGKLPDRLQSACDKDANLARLFIKVTKLATMKKELAKSSSRYAKAYGAVLKTVKETGYGV